MNTAAPGRTSKRTKIIITLAAALAVSIAAVATGWWLLADRLPRPTDDPVAIAKFAATADFARMTDDQKAPYLHRIRDNLDAVLRAAEAGQLSPQEQVEAVRNVVRGRARLEMKQYAALPAGPARRAQLDKLIDEQEVLRPRAKKAAAQTGRQVAPDPVMLKQFVESLAPDERIHMAGFVYDLVQRRRERGLPPWPFAEAQHN